LARRRSDSDGGLPQSAKLRRGLAASLEVRRVRRMENQGGWMASGESSLSKGVGGDDLAKSREGNDFGCRRRGQKASEVDEAGVGVLRWHRFVDEG
jgi:hypothetical protein